MSALFAIHVDAIKHVFITCQFLTTLFHNLVEVVQHILYERCVDQRVVGQLVRRL